METTILFFPKFVRSCCVVMLFRHFHLVILIFLTEGPSYQLFIKAYLSIYLFVYLFLKLINIFVSDDSPLPSSSDHDSSISPSSGRKHLLQNLKLSEICERRIVKQCQPEDGNIEVSPPEDGDEGESSETNLLWYQMIIRF